MKASQCMRAKSSKILIVLSLWSTCNPVQSFGFLPVIPVPKHSSCSLNAVKVNSNYNRGQKRSGRPIKKREINYEKPVMAEPTNVPKLLHSEPEIGIEPKYLGRLDLTATEAAFGDDRVYAYLIDKPPGWSIFTSKKKSRKKGTTIKDDLDEGVPDENFDAGIDDETLLEFMTPEEREVFLKEKQEQTVASNVITGNFDRPCIMSWLKEHLSSEGIDSVRAGPKFWKALAGAVDIDDSGVVLLVPKKSTSDILVEQIDFLAVVGNGKRFAKSQKLDQRSETANIELKAIKTLDRSRREDIALIVSVSAFDSAMVCSSVIDRIQNQFEDGIRGDPSSSPLDRRAQRRLLHCEAIQISSLLQDDWKESRAALPSDFQVLLNAYDENPFQGRSSFQINLENTNTYREINGAADGYPGWTVDRYDRWLFIKHDAGFPFGPIPDLEEGKTEGIYIYDGLRDRSMTGPLPKPNLHSGSPAPDDLVVMENRVKYIVNLGDQFSTGLFLDQRPQRGWLSQNCDSNTRILNCFAHCGGFSVAAACAGASTVSLDLDKKWLDRIEGQMVLNGVEFDDRHDIIYGDCFDWLARLSKRNEKFDIVILDPPSTSVGKKKKRWSVKKDMSSLVSLATSLVREGGMLWTCTNCASLPMEKFEESCRKGIIEAGRECTLDRIAPMPCDFPSIGSQPVKNLVWRIE